MGRKPAYKKRRWGNFDITEIVRVANHPEGHTKTYLLAIYHAALKRHKQRHRPIEEQQIGFEAAQKLKAYLTAHNHLETGFRKYTSQTSRNAILDESHPKVLRASELASKWLADANALAESGQKQKAEEYYSKAQFWLDRYNKLTGKS